MGAALAAAVTCALLLSGCTNDDSNANGDDLGSDKDVADDATTLLTDVSSQLGFSFVHEPMTENYYFMPEMTTPGCAIFDYDNDGDLDLYLINSARGPDSPATGRPVNRLFAQQDDGAFVDATDASGLGDDGYGIGVSVGDYDNDGDTDVYLTNLDHDALYRNNGDGTFTNATAEAGVMNEHWSSSSSFFDYDRDGFLDIYVVNYVTVAAARICSDASGLQDFCGPQVFPGVPDVLYHNNGDGTFTDVSESVGLTAKIGKGLGVVCRDFDSNGWMDIYVANDGEPNQLWLNTDGRFEDVAYMNGAAVNEYGEAEASMGLAVGDFDNDGDEDIFMTHLAAETNTLYKNDGRANFSDATSRAGLATISTAFTGFGTCFVDLDLDRDLDLLVVNGRVKRGGKPHAHGSCSEFWNNYSEPNQLFLNQGGGRFEDATDQTGSYGTKVEVSRGLAWGDIDADGDLDFLVTNCKGPARLYRNNAASDSHWLIVRAFDPALNRDALGARVTVTTSSGSLVRSIHTDGSYACSSDPRAHFGLGADDRVESLTVAWPDGTIETFGALDGVDRSVVIRKGQSEAAGE